jgi:hypothetical protein
MVMLRLRGVSAWKDDNHFESTNLWLHYFEATAANSSRAVYRQIKLAGFALGFSRSA